MIEFTVQNTTGYSQDELDQFNEDWENETRERELEIGTDEYDFYLKIFSDRIARS